MPLTPELSLVEVLNKRKESLGLNNPELPLSNPTHNKLVQHNHTEESQKYLHTNYSQKEFTKE